MGGRQYCFGVVGLGTLGDDWGVHVALSIGNTVLVVVELCTLGVD